MTNGRNRKFFYGDKVIMKSKVHYPRHMDHKGIVTATRIIRLATAGYTKVNYNVECGCGSRLVPKGDHMDLIAGPTGDDLVRLVHELRMEHFLDLIKSTINKKPLEKQVATVLAPLTERDKYILVKRFGLDGKDAKLLRGIAIDLGLTKARIQQVEYSLLERLRQ